MLIKPYEALLALRFLLGKKSTNYISFTSWASIIAMLLSVMTLIIVLSVMNGFREIIETTYVSVDAEVQVLGDEHQATDWKKIEQSIAATSGVLRHAPFLEKQGLVLNGKRALPMTIRGIDPLQEKAIVKIRQSIPEDVFATLQADSRNVVVGSEVAAEYDLNLGKKLSLVIPKSGAGNTLSSPDVASFTVSGIFQTRDNKSNASFIYLHLQDLQQFVGAVAGAQSGFQVAVVDMEGAPAIAKRLRATLPTSLRVVDWQQKNAAQYKAVKFEKLLMTLMLCVIILISGLNIIITTIMTVNAKRGEIAILMTMGAPEKSIARVFIFNGFILGMGGIVFGVGAGVWIAPNIGNIIATLEKALAFRVFDPTVLDIVHIPSRLEGGDVLLVSIVAFSVAMIATLLPALHAARINPVEAFRYE